MQKNILVTGANGQLGKSLQAIAPMYANDFRFHFTDVEELDITDCEDIARTMEETRADFIVNAAAYTAVDKAESDVEKAYLLNETAVRLLAEATKKNGAMLVHISTDYVFDGTSEEPYRPDMQPNPISVYGQSKWAGERAIHEVGGRAVIIRTEWLYSRYGGNFVKTMLRLAEERGALRVVSDQVGAPTLAGDLARLILRVLECEERLDGVSTYHFSDGGRATWYDFACEIIRLSGLPCPVHPISTQEYPTPATRPNFSLFDLSKTIKDFNFDIPDWKTSLAQEFPHIYHNHKNGIR